MSNPMFKKTNLTGSSIREFLARWPNAIFNENRELKLFPYKSPLFTTLTGVDASTDLRELESISKRFPFAEWGFLYSSKNCGNEKRFPPLSVLHEAFRLLPVDVHVALHIWGDGVVDLLERKAEVTKLVEMVADRVGRVQLNFNQRRKRFDLERFSCLVDDYPTAIFITQHNDANKDVWKALRHKANYSVLFDSSGGQGIEQDNWPEPLDGVFCGYAGGLGPNKITEKLPQILAAAGGNPYWIDMESRIRNEDDLFDIHLVEACLREVEQFSRQCSAG